MNLQMKQNRSEFVELLYSTGREGMDEVIGQLEELGFFQAPASSKFHLNHEGGLLEHSLNVCKVGLMLREQMLALKPDLEESLNKESVIIAALLHDICKADIYQKCIRKRKDRLGQWVYYETYELDYSDFRWDTARNRSSSCYGWGWTCRTMKSWPSAGPCRHGTCRSRART